VRTSGLRLQTEKSMRLKRSIIRASRAKSGRLGLGEGRIEIGPRGGTEGEMSVPMSATLATRDRVGPAFPLDTL
jgi:hypothetical protein